MHIEPIDIMTVATATAAIAKDNPGLYGDLAQPSVQNLGKALCTVTNVINTVLTPFELFNETVRMKKEQFLSSYEKKLTEIPKEKVCEANPAIIGHITENAKHKISDAELREKYARLLASASNSDNLTKPLLSFDAVLDQLSPYETEFLHHLSPKSSEKSWPIADIYCRTESGLAILKKNLPGIRFKNLPQDTISLMLSNFERLGLVIFDKTIYLQPKFAIYGFVYDSPLLKNFEEQAKITREATKSSWPRCEVKEGVFLLTDFGESFINTVIL